MKNIFLCYDNDKFCSDIGGKGMAEKDINSNDFDDKNQNIPSDPENTNSESQGSLDNNVFNDDIQKEISKMEEYKNNNASTNTSNYTNSIQEFQDSINNMNNEDYDTINIGDSREEALKFFNDNINKEKSKRDFT